MIQKTQSAVDALSVPGVAADTESLLKLRHLVQHIPERRLQPTGLPGGFVSRRRGRGLETVDLRLYSVGDDIRHIDRNATARTGQPHVRTFRDERERNVLLLADFRPSMLWGTRRALRSVAAAEALALVGWRVVESGGRVGLIAFGAGDPVFVSARGRERGMVRVVGGLAAAHRSALLAVAEAHDRGEAGGAKARGGRKRAHMADPLGQEQPLEARLDLAVKLVPTGGMVVLASGLDHPGDGFDAVAAAIDRRAALTVLLVTDAFEQRAPAGSYPFVSESGRIAWASFGVNRAADARDPRLERLERLGVAALSIDASADPETMATAIDMFDGGHR